MASVTVGDITIHFDEANMSTNGNSTFAFQGKFRITNNTSSPLTLKAVRCSWPAGGSSGTTTYLYHSSPESGLYTTPSDYVAQTYTIPAGAVEHPLTIYVPKTGGTGIRYYLAGDPIRGQFIFQGMETVLTFYQFFNTVIAQPWPEPQNTGYKAYALLEEYYTDTGELTGNEKYNDPADPDYVVPVYDTVTCPLP